jgi:hypothetical protein
VNNDTRTLNININIDLTYDEAQVLLDHLMDLLDERGLSTETRTKFHRIYNAVDDVLLELT